MAFAPINEKSSAVYTATILDEAGDPVTSSMLDSLTLTLFDANTGNIINSRNNQNALNANQVTVNGSGFVTWDMLPADNVIVTDTNSSEVHVAEFYAVWNGGASAVSSRAIFTVVNFRKLS